MKVSVITAVHNRRETVARTIKSVMNQREALEYIVVDGMSTDGTSEEIKRHGASVDVSIREHDSGIYDALNKGIANASGEVIGFLHADDVFASDEVIGLVTKAFDSGDYDAVYGDLVYVRGGNKDQVVRYWKAGRYSRGKFRRGWMPPHPTVYVRKSIYEKLGGYRTDLSSAADYECMVRLFYKHSIRVAYIPEVLVKMQVGGVSNSTWKQRIRANRDDALAWSENGIRAPLGLRFLKPASKLIQYIHRR